MSVFSSELVFNYTSKNTYVCISHFYSTLGWCSTLYSHSNLSRQMSFGIRNTFLSILSPGNCLPFVHYLNINLLFFVTDDVLYVGTSKGNLAKYNINIKYEDGKMKVESSHLCCYYKNFSKKPIQQLDVIPHYNILISLSGTV